MTYPLSHTIVQTGHSARRNDSPPASSSNDIRSVEVHSMDPMVSRSYRVNAAAAMASMASEATARRHNLMLIMIHLTKLEPTEKVKCSSKTKIMKKLNQFLK